MSIDRVATRSEGPVLLIGRVAIAALFLPVGWNHLIGIPGFAQYLATTGLPGPALGWAIVGAIVEFFGSLAILVGFKTRYAALALFIFTVVAAFTGHPYWTAAAAQRMGQQMNFWKDIAIAGGLLFVFVRGAGPLSFDRR